MIHPNLGIAIKAVRQKFINTNQVIRTEKWQGITLEHDMKESLNISFQAFMPSNISELQFETKPNLPWADLHFEERVSGIPSNPGETYKIWPYYKMDKEMRNVDDKFTHTYMERMWPRWSNATNIKDPDEYYDKKLKGIRYEYGDFQDIFEILLQQPYTRQAFLPIFFPEDTGAKHGGRIPCTIGYHFIRRDNYLHIVYYIRSCDYLRHFRDDIYLAVRKVMWLIEKLKLASSKWGNVKPGIFTMHITSLHCFVSDIYAIEKEIKHENK